MHWQHFRPLHYVAIVVIVITIVRSALDASHLEATGTKQLSPFSTIISEISLYVILFLLLNKLSTIICDLILFAFFRISSVTYCVALNPFVQAMHRTLRKRSYTYHR